MQSHREIIGSSYRKTNLYFMPERTQRLRSNMWTRQYRDSLGIICNGFLSSTFWAIQIEDYSLRMKMQKSRNSAYLYA